MLTKTAITITVILDAARTLFLAKSYADVTMSEIARAAELTKGALYHHFDSKKELYLALLHRDLEEKRELFAAAADFEGSCRERLARFTRVLYELPWEKRRLIRLVRRDINTFKDPMRSALIRVYQAALPEQVERILSEGVSRGEIEPQDLRLLSWHYVAMVEVVLSHYADRVFDRVETKLDYVLDLFLEGASSRNPEGNATV